MKCHVCFAHFSKNGQRAEIRWAFVSLVGWSAMGFRFCVSLPVDELISNHVKYFIFGLKRWHVGPVEHAQNRGFRKKLRKMSKFASENEGITTPMRSVKNFQLSDILVKNVEKLLKCSGNLVEMVGKLVEKLVEHEKNDTLVCQISSFWKLSLFRDLHWREKRTKFTKQIFSAVKS